MSKKEDLKICVAGLGLRGGRKEGAYYCLIEDFPEEGRSFLRGILKASDSPEKDGDLSLKRWSETHQIKSMTVDFPLDGPACSKCELDCPGINACPEPSVVSSRKWIESFLFEDESYYSKAPKDYEREREKEKLNEHPRKTLLGRSLKRRLKRPYLPYWNRPIDAWVWPHYYDDLAEFLTSSFDSFGQASLMTLSRWEYLKRHLPHGPTFYESSTDLILIELARCDVLSIRDLKALGDLEESGKARLSILRSLEKKLSLFIYAHDMELMIKDVKAFTSFLLALSALQASRGKLISIGAWAKEHGESFIIPKF